MKHERIMDYIFKNEKEKKYAGEIYEVIIHPHMEFSIYNGDYLMQCSIDYVLDEWHISIYEGHHDKFSETSLSFLNDTYWNSNAIGELFNDIEIGNRIAYAIKAIYERHCQYFTD